MKRKALFNNIILTLSILLPVITTNCKKEEETINYTTGTFPDTVINLSEINSEYDDYNTTLCGLSGNALIIFSTNRKSAGGEFGLEQAVISFTFDQVTGVFGYGDEISYDSFLQNLIAKAETVRDDFGPYRLFSPLDGYEYLLISSEDEDGDLDLYYLKNFPIYNSSLPEILGPYPVNLLNTVYNDAYICFDSNYDTAYFVSDRDGDYDIYMESRSDEIEIDYWLNQSFSASVRADSVNSTGNEKCPIIFRDMMFFASDRAGGMGGYDLYYSVFKNGNWSSPVNLGPDINTSSDEFRPVLGYHPDFTNCFLLFSSNRQGGSGGFDLYFCGIDLPE